MRFDVSDLRKRAGTRVTRKVTVAPDALADIADVSVVKPLEAEIEAWSTGEGVVVKVAAIGEAELQCSRCLESYRMPVNLVVEQEFRDDVRNDDADEDDEDDALPFPADGLIDIAELVREAFLLEMPMKPLCSPDCRGLCPVCGQNLNRGTCNCSTDTFDPRLAKLRDLLSERGVSEDGSAKEEEI
jgi:uncharacterized protein